MRSLGLDLGSKRIGVAASDGTGTIATPHSTVARTGDATAEHRVIAALVAELEAEVVVVGLPLSLDGSDGPAARAVRAEADVLAGALAVPVELVDERFTTVSADRVLAAGGVKADRRREIIDRTAAAVILQSWLDRHPRSGS